MQEQSLERADLNLRSARGFFEVGTRPKSDVARAEVDVANARWISSAPATPSAWPRVALNTAMGIPADTPTQVQDILFYQQMQLDPKQLQAQALAQRPEYKQVRCAVSQAEAQLRRANRDFLPDVTGHGTYGGARNDLNEVWEVGVALTWNIFDGGNMIAQVREKRALVDSGPGPGEGHRAQHRPGSRAGVSRRERGPGAHRGLPTAVASAQENFRAGPGPVRRRGRHHPRADRRPAVPDPGAKHRSPGPGRLPRRARPRWSGPPAGGRARGNSWAVVARLRGHEARSLPRGWSQCWSGPVSGATSTPRVVAAPQSTGLPGSSRGPLTAAVSATGNLNAVTTVQVGSQVSGQIKELLADFNTLVKKDQIIARIDPEIFQAKVNQAQADVASAQATVINQEAQVQKAGPTWRTPRAALAEAKANTAKAQVSVVDGQRDLDRKTQLFRRELIANSDLDSAQAVYDSAVAQVDASRAKEESLSAAIQSATAQLRVTEAQLHLGGAPRSTRRRPGSCRRRRISSTPPSARRSTVSSSRGPWTSARRSRRACRRRSLFTIAEDLTKMQVEVSVDEADIGRIRLEDRVSFTVDLFPGQSSTAS